MWSWATLEGKSRGEVGDVSALLSLIEVSFSLGCRFRWGLGFQGRDCQAWTDFQPLGGVDMPNKLCV